MSETSDSSRRKLVIVGNGVAAGRVLEELFARTPDRYDVTILGAEATGAEKGCTRSIPVKLENGRIYLDMGVAGVAAAP